MSTERRRFGTIVEPSREIDIVHTTDVLVVGSGPAGLAAALAAARCGVEVTLVERFGCFGGNITTVGVEGMAWYRHEQSHAATRNMSCCALHGQGAGIAAAVSLHSDQELGDVDIGKIHAELERQGVGIR